MSKFNGVDVVIIGAGPAGAAAAALLCNSGYRVLIVEKERFPRFVIGESLLPHCMDMLDECGLLESVHQQNFQKKIGAVFLKKNNVEIFEFSDKYTPGWDYTYQVPRAQFDHILANGANNAGAEILYEHSVVTVDFSGENPEITIEAPDSMRETLSPRFVLDASGFGRVLPRLLDLDTPSDFPPRESLFAHVRGFQRNNKFDSDMGWLCIHPENNQVWFWMIPFSDGTTSLGIVAPPDHFSSYSNDHEKGMRAILQTEPNLKNQIDNIEFILGPKRIKGYARSVSKTWGQHFALLGNAGGFLDPVFSSGVTIALKSASIASGLLHRQFSGERIDWQVEFSDYLQSGIDTFKTYVNAWYDGTFQKIMFFDKKPHLIKTMVCSILAGYVWDETNPYVRHHQRRLKALSEICEYSY